MYKEQTIHIYFGDESCVFVKLVGEQKIHMYFGYH